MTTSTGQRVEAAVAAATAAFALVALARPELLSGDRPSPGQAYYARMYAARALPLAGVMYKVSRAPTGGADVLAVAAVAQLGDALIGLAERDRRQALPTLAAASICAARALQRRASS